MRSSSGRSGGRQGGGANSGRELLGTIGFLSIIRAVLAKLSIRTQLDSVDNTPTLRAWTDYKGVVSHGNGPDSKLKQG